MANCRECLSPFLPARRVIPGDAEAR